MLRQPIPNREPEELWDPIVVAPPRAVDAIDLDETERADRGDPGWVCITCRSSRRGDLFVPVAPLGGEGGGVIRWSPHGPDVRLDLVILPRLDRRAVPTILGPVRLETAPVEQATRRVGVQINAIGPVIQVTLVDHETGTTVTDWLTQ